MTLALAPFTLNQYGNTFWFICGKSEMRITCDKLSVPMWNKLATEWCLQCFKNTHVTPCSFELSEDIRSAFISKHTTSNGIRPSPETLVSLFQQCAMLLRSLPSMEISRTSMDERRRKRKIDERALRRLVRMVEKNTSNIQRPEGQPGRVWGHSFNKYYTPHTKPSRA